MTPDEGLREALRVMAARWEHEAATRIADPKASAASLLAAGVQRSHAMSVRAALAVAGEGLTVAELIAAVEALPYPSDEPAGPQTWTDGWRDAIEAVTDLLRSSS